MYCRSLVAILTNAGRVLVALSCLAIGASSVLADVTDSFSRPPTSSTTAVLGTTESGLLLKPPGQIKHLFRRSGGE